jgi:predicted DNA-binding antitoxin AbrB/MazE fold protein
MSKEFRARFSEGVLKPLETVDLKEGEEVRASLPSALKGKACVRRFELALVAGGAW